MARKKTTGRTHLTKGVSMEPVFYEKTLARATALNMTFSQYLRHCIAHDINHGGSIIVTPKKAK